jgi:hypothetical protein
MPSLLGAGDKDYSPCEGAGCNDGEKTECEEEKGVGSCKTLLEFKLEKGDGSICYKQM